MLAQFLHSNLAIFVFHDPRCSKQASTPNGVKATDGKVTMSYKSIFQDIRSAFDWVHMQVCHISWELFSNVYYLVFRESNRGH